MEKLFDVSREMDHLKRLCDIYLSTGDRDALEKKIALALTAFYQSKNSFKEIASFFQGLGLDEFQIRAENVYFGHRSVQLRDSLEKLSRDDFIRDYEVFRKEADSTPYKKIFNHYVEMHALLQGFEIATGKKGRFDSQLLSDLLEAISWSWKSNAYREKIREIVKFNDRHTKSSVIIISNNKSKDILAGLVEIHRQRRNPQDYKIIIVSNNEQNQVPEIVDLVDTFIAMRSNDGAYLARNVGSVFALSDLLIFMEDDGVPEAGFVQAHEHLHGSDVAAVRGACLTRTNGIMPSWYWLGTEVKPSLTSLEGNCSFDAKRFFKVGGWGDYIFFGHGGCEICYRMLQENSCPENHLYSPGPKIYHDYCIANKIMENKKMAQHASWQVLKFSYKDFYLISEKWK